MLFSGLSEIIFVVFLLRSICFPNALGSRRDLDPGIKV